MQLPASARKRGTYIGGPDAAAIVGANRFATAGDVYARLVAGWSPEVTKRMKRGLLVEAGLLEYASAYRGQEITRDVFYRHDRNPHFCCSVDGAEGKIERPRTIHETKTTRSESAGPDFDDRWGPTDSDAVDPGAAAQVQWELGITEAHDCHVWLYDADVDDDPRHYYLERNHNRIGELFDACDAFWWDHVVPRRPPNVAPYDADAARAIWPTAVVGLKAEVTEEMVLAAIEYASGRVIRDTAIEAMDRAAAFLKMAMGRAEEARWGGTKKDPRPKSSVFFKAHKLSEPVTNWEAVAYELARRFSVPGAFFHGLVAENTRRPWSSRHLQVHVAGIKRKKGTNVSSSKS
jgi:hypothetical protein